MANRNLNNVVLNGRITADATLNSNGTIAYFTLAVADLVKAQDGKWNETVDFIDCKCFQKGIFDYLKKGVEITLTGSLKQEKWEDKDGNKKSRVLVYANDIILGDRPKMKDAE